MSRRIKGDFVGMALQLPADLHRLLDIYCAEMQITLKAGVILLLREQLVKVGLRVGTVPWAREPIAPLPETQAPVRETPAPVAATKEAIPETQAPEGETEEPLEDWEKRCPECGERMEKTFTSCPECQYEYTREIEPTAQPAHVQEALKYTVTQHEIVNENENEDPEFDPQLHYDSVSARGLSPRSALLDTLRAIEAFGLEDRYPAWAPGTPPVANGHAASPAAGPITSAEYEVPDTWVDNAGHTRAQNLSRFGEDEAVEYWPPTPGAT